MIKVYLASAYRIGDTAINVKRQIDMADRLMDEGFSPYVPVLSHFQHLVHPRDYEDWIRNDLIWLRLCDCILRLVGESEGADLECKEAAKNYIPVFFDIEEIKEYFKGKTNG